MDRQASTQTYAGRTRTLVATADSPTYLHHLYLHTRATLPFALHTCRRALSPPPTFAHSLLPTCASFVCARRLPSVAHGCARTTILLGRQPAAGGRHQASCLRFSCGAHSSFFALPHYARWYVGAAYLAAPCLWAAAPSACTPCHSGYHLGEGGG